jgi:arylsulfatase A
MTRATKNRGGLKISLLWCVHILASLCLGRSFSKPPDIVLVLCDDLGIGDVHCYAPSNKIATPNWDRCAREGMRFTDAHSPSSVCTPTRYGLLCGRYAWRTKLKSGVLGGLSPTLISSGITTLPEELANRGYRTGCFGKWHLGIDWAQTGDGKPPELSIETEASYRSVDLSQTFRGGPLSAGFDTFFGISASLDMVPYTYLKQDQVEQVPSSTARFPMVAGRTSGWTRQGPAAEGFRVEEVLPTTIDRAIEWLDGIDRQQPFFLYLPLTSPHTPIAPSDEFAGKSGLNHYADFVMQTDAEIGRLLKVLEQRGTLDETLILLTSDNGCAPQADIAYLKTVGHDPSAGLRGHKADIYEGGHRIPLVARWPKAIAGESVSDHPVVLTDLMATCLEAAEIALADPIAPDSFSLMPLWTTKSPSPSALRRSMIHHSVNGTFAFRSGKWKLILAPDSGGWSEPRPRSRVAGQGKRHVQLYDLEKDLRESQNVADSNPDVVASLLEELQQMVGTGRSRPGKPLENDQPVELWKYADDPRSP